MQKYIDNVPEIKKYVIMPNHIHLIIQIDNGTMWAVSATASVGASTLCVKVSAGHLHRPLQEINNEF